MNPAPDKTAPPSTSAVSTGPGFEGAAQPASHLVRHELRVRRMLLIGSAATGTIAAGWAVLFALQGAGLSVLLCLATMIASGLTVALIRARRLRPAAFLLMATVYLAVCLSGLFLDVPTARAPRAMHQFLLSLGVASCLLMRNERVWLRHGVPATCLATYAWFACANPAWPSAYAVPEHLRVPGVWFDQAFALIVLYLSLDVIQTDVAESNAQKGELRDGLARGEMVLYFQPQVSDEGCVVGAEALVRWNHPVRGLVAPGHFIPLAESSGLMLPLGDWVLRTACQQLAVWSAHAETAQLQLAVNVSASQFAQRGFEQRVLDIVGQTGANPRLLKLELTESMLAHDIEDVIAKMAALRKQGVGFSLDDFGTGFSSLSYLRRLPLDQLKIDQSFVRNMLQSPEDAAIVRAVITLGTSLGLHVIAEGVETQEHRRYLADLGCLMFQGYLFSKPVPIARFDSFLGDSLSGQHASRKFMEPLPMQAAA